MSERAKVLKTGFPILALGLLFAILIKNPENGFSKFYFLFLLQHRPLAETSQDTYMGMIATQPLIVCAISGRA